MVKSPPNSNDTLGAPPESQLAGRGLQFGLEVPPVPLPTPSESPRVTGARWVKSQIVTPSRGRDGLINF